MASFTGIAQAYMASDDREGFYPVNTRTEVRSGVTNEKSYAGSNSLQIKPGGMHDAYYGADAGPKEISFMCWPPSGGKCCLQLLTRGRGVLDKAWAIGSVAWEKLSINYNFPARGVYLVRLCNFTPPNGDTRAFFDDVV